MAIDPTILRNELDVLTRGLSHLLRAADAPHGASIAPPIAVPVAAAMEALGAGLIDADFEAERRIRARPIMATASAFAIGMAIGLLLRRT